MRKSITISLISLLFLSQAGYYFYYAAQRAQVRHEMQEQLSTELSENLLELIIQEDNETAINWQEPGKEFYLDGKLYDVASKKKINGKTFLYCVNDKNEHELVQDMAKMVKAGSDANTSDAAGKHTIKFQWADYILHSNERAMYSINNTVQYHTGFDAALVSSVQEVNAPPPRA